MELFQTLIKKEHESHSRWNSGNEYVVGRISGISLVMCGKGQRGLYYNEDGAVIKVACEPESYENFVVFVEKQYPKMCEFYYKKKI